MFVAFFLWSLFARSQRCFLMIAFLTSTDSTEQMVLQFCFIYSQNNNQQTWVICVICEHYVCINMAVGVTTSSLWHIS